MQWFSFVSHASKEIVFFEKFAYICDVFDTNIENVFDICKSNRNIFRICIKMIR